MGQDQSSLDNVRATTTQEFIEALSGEKFDDNNGVSIIDLIPGVNEFTEEQVNQVHAHIEKVIKKHREILRTLSKNRNSGFLEQYKGITAGLGNPATASQARGNEPLNRYMNIVAYDHSRVTVKPTQFNLNNDYINANWIPGKRGKHHYIATQGPVPDSMPSFWQMIWENNVEVLVMVTNEVEGGKLKCHRYWPEPTEGTPKTMQHSTFFVTFLDQDVHPKFVVRRFRMQHSETKEERTIFQYSYTGWPDHGVPASTKELIEFRHHIKDVHVKSNGPMLVHCSAGVGRTGTFIGLDRFLDACLECKDTTVLEIVADMRHHRNFMVQSPIQFVFLYLACLDGLERIQKIAEKAKRYLKMTIEEQQEQELAELTRTENILAALENEEKKFDTLRMKKKQKEPVQVLFQEQDEKKKNGKSDGDANEKTDAESSTQLQSTSSEIENSQTVSDFKPEGLKNRIKSLEESREAWRRAFQEAEENWKKEKSQKGEVYDIEFSMAPMESRLAALAEAQLAWEQRASGDLELAALKENISSVHSRLESLCGYVYGDHWKTRGHGFRGKQAEAPFRTHTIEMLGSLQNRLVLLSENTMAYQERIMESKYLGSETFQKEIQEQRMMQEKVIQERLKQQREKEEREKREEDERRRAQEEQHAKEIEIKREQEERDMVKQRFKDAERTFKPDYDPVRAREEKLKELELEKQKEQDELQQFKAAQQQEKEKQTEKLSKKDIAKKKASLFLGKLRK